MQAFRHLTDISGVHICLFYFLKCVCGVKLGLCKEFRGSIAFPAGVRRHLLAVSGISTSASGLKRDRERNAS